MTDQNRKSALNFRSTKFIISAPDITALPNEQGAEIAIVGRSNSGKSSSINAICDNRNLAKTSRTPGRTRLINQFQVANRRYLVDLPGYGYAKVSDQVQSEWKRNLSNYLQMRKNLIGIIITMDIRNPMKDLDRMVIDWSIGANLPALILLTKADKLGTNRCREAVGEVRTMLSEFGGSFKIIAFSALKKIGIDETRSILEQWYELSRLTDEDAQEQ